MDREAWGATVHGVAMSRTRQAIKQQQQHTLIKPQSVPQTHHLQKFPFTPLFFLHETKTLKVRSHLAKFPV